MRNSVDLNYYINNRKCPERSVHLGRKLRFEKAKKQKEIPIVSRDKIISLTNEFINLYGIEVYNGDNIVETEGLDLFDFNKNISRFYSGLTSNKDIIWMKFTTDRRLGVVACSNDINFDFPENETVYDEPDRIVNGKIKSWKYNTSGILVHSVGLKWEKSFVLVFPLIGLKNGVQGKKQRHEIETGIGNYLISKGVPIIDYYSHRI